ncbi:peptidylprolyl isomerase [Negadavirga shengliensis]|uniref:Peptidylprolyl isomerase n=1 Tax=Negadavirga shengliensis TaxID=1389218 RepID=A0ABV9T0R1_9BACT
MPVGTPEVSDAAPPSETFLIKIDQDPVFPDEFLYVISKNRDLRKVPDKIDEKEFEESFNLFVNYRLKVKHAEELGLDRSEEFVTEFETFKKDIKKPYLLENSLEEGEIKKAYSRMQEVIKASHILIQFPENANKEDSIAVSSMIEKIRSDVEKGEDFNELAYKYSDDPSAESNKGDLGYFTALQMVSPFEDAAYGLEIGEISDPVLTDFGYHLIKLESRKPNPGEVRVSHILVRTDPEDPSSEDRAKRKIAGIYDELQKEESRWEDVVSMFSEDQGSKSNGGLIPWFGVGAIVPEFENAAFSLTEIGEISNPVKTPFGFHIIRLEDRRPIPPYEEMEAMIKSKILRDSRSSLIRSQVMAMQRAKYQLWENDILYQKIKTIARENGGAAPSPDNFKQKVKEAGLLDVLLIKTSEESFAVKDLLDFIDTQKKNIKPDPGNFFQAWYDKFLETVLDEAEEKDLYQNNDEFRQLIREYRNGILLFNLMNDLVWQKALEDSLGQIEYYERHRDRYQWTERVPALVVKMNQEKQLDKIRRFLSKTRFSDGIKEKIEEEFLQDSPLLFSAESNVYEISKHDILKRLDLSNSFHEIQLEGQTVFILSGGLIAAGPKSLEETKGKLIQDYQQFLENELIASLKERYPVEINEEEKNRIYQIVVE